MRNGCSSVNTKLALSAEPESLFDVVRAGDLGRAGDTGYGGDRSSWSPRFLGQSHANTDHVLPLFRFSQCLQLML